jgi:hypothetical protein
MPNAPSLRILPMRRLRCIQLRPLRIDFWGRVLARSAVLREASQPNFYAICYLTL